MDATWEARLLRTFSQGIGRKTGTNGPGVPKEFPRDLDLTCYILVLLALRNGQGGRQMGDSGPGTYVCAEIPHI